MVLCFVLTEHPAYTDSWNIDGADEFVKFGGVSTEFADQCMCGLTMPSEVDGLPTPNRKPTRFLNDSWCVLNELSARRDGSHVHQHFVGGDSAKAAEYPDKSCRAICRGLANQTRYDVLGKGCSDGLNLMALQPLDASVNEFPVE